MRILLPLLSLGLIRTTNAGAFNPPTSSPTAVPSSSNPTSIPTAVPSSSSPTAVLISSSPTAISSESPSIQPTSNLTISSSSSISDNNLAMIVILIGGGTIFSICLIAYLIKRYMNTKSSTTCNTCINNESGTQTTDPDRGIQFSSISSNEQDLAVANLTNAIFIEDAIPVPSSEHTVLAIQVE